MRTVLRRIILSGFLLSNCVYAQPAKLNRDSLGRYFDEGIRYLSHSQLQNEKISGKFTGEWPSFIENLTFIPFLGKRGKTAYDSNCFNTLFIHNALAEFYFRFRQNPEIPAMMELARKNAAIYRNDSSFNFWPLLPRPDHLKRCGHQDCAQRRPVNFRYRYAFINNYANIFDDADDTAAGLLAAHYAGLLGDTTDGAFSDPRLLAARIEQYRDTGNRKTNWYNKRLGFGERTGAYLTWFGPDRKRSGFLRWFFTSHEEQQILYGRNEVDCIVNANILRSMHLSGRSPRAINDCIKLFREVIARGLCKTCGVYYPTEFAFHYAVAKCISDGVPGLGEFRRPLLEDVISKMNDDGSWSSYMSGNDLQASLYALNSLLLLDTHHQYHEKTEAALDYVMSQATLDGTGMRWPAGIFFSGGSAVRYMHVWRSEAYTTCLGLEAISNYIRNAGLQ